MIKKATRLFKNSPNARAVTGSSYEFKDEGFAVKTTTGSVVSGVSGSATVIAGEYTCR